MHADARPRAAGVHAAASHDGAASGNLACGQLLEGHPELVVGPMLEHTVLKFHLFGFHLPDAGRAGNHLLSDVLSRSVSGETGLEGHAAAAGVRREADAVGIADLRVDVLNGDAEHLGQLLGNGGAGAADIRANLRSALRCRPG